MHPSRLGRAGFTLIELLIVMAILSIIAAIAIPSFLGQRRKAAQTEAKTNLESMRMLQEQFIVEDGSYTDSIGTCGADENNVAAIQVELPGFKPGTSLKFSYCIEANKDFNGAAQTPCFWARAFGDTGTVVVDTEFGVDCNNQKTY